MRSAVALVLLAVFAGCASPGGRSSFGPYAGTSFLRSALISPPPYLYVASPATRTYKLGSVQEYPLGSAIAIRTIVAGINQPAALAVDRAGELFVANVGSNTVTVYSPGATKPSRAIVKGIDVPKSLAFSHSGNLFVANEPSKSGDERGSLSVFAPNGTKPLRTITKGINEPQAMAFDANDRLYVANLYYGPSGGRSSSGSIRVYAQGGVTPIRTITRGVNVPWAIAIDSSENLYVANYGSPYGINYPPYSGNVTVYLAAASKPSYTITAGIGNPNALAVDSQHQLYVASNYAYYWITEYAPGGKTVQGTIATTASTLLLDASDNLYAGGLRVNVYRPGSFSPAYTIDRSANALALGSL